MINFWAFMRKLWSEHSAARGQKGTLIDDLAVKPTGLVMGDFYNSLSEQQKVNNILNWADMTDAQLDFFGNKFFLPRISGGYSIGYIRISFNEKKDIELKAEARAVAANNLEYRVIQPGYISRNSFKDSTDRIALYYIDIPVIASAKGDEYNTESGEVVRLTNVDFTYQSVTNPEDIAQGTLYEDNPNYFKRLAYGINDRSIMNKKSMYVVLPGFFPVIKAMYMAGSGDRYMTRDLISGFDLSTANVKADFLGKLYGENLVKHLGFYGIFPPDVGSIQSDRYWGPHSAVSDYRYPLSIEQSASSFNPDSEVPSSSDPAFLGFPLDQECEDDRYKGLFFNDFKRFMEVRTNDLFDIVNEEIGFTPTLPDSTWVYGANGYKPGNFGIIADDKGAIDVLQFNDTTITMMGGGRDNVSVAKDISKRTGVKLTGKFVMPAIDDGDDLALNSNLQIMVGGVTGSEYVDAYTGIGFGVRMINEYDAEDTSKTNAVIYFAHSEQYGTAQVYATDFDINNHISISDIGALAEVGFRLAYSIEYEFEFIIYDDLRMTLYINKSTDREAELPAFRELHFELPKKVLNIFSDKNKGGILSTDSERYGTMMKVSLDTKAVTDTDKAWQIVDLKAFDMNPSRGMALYAINMEGIESPVSLYLRAFGSSAISGARADGYQAYLWDKEAQSAATGTSELTRGAWAEANGVSNPDGSKSVSTGLLKHEISNIDRYLINSKFGKSIFVMVVTSGVSKGPIRYAGDIRDDIHSILRVDYIKVESENIASYHANNKADIYLATLSNSEDYEIVTTTITKLTSDTFFEMSLANDCKMPVAEIISVSIGTTIDEAEVLSESEYTVVETDPLLINSSKEIKRIVLDESDADTITVQYRTYPEIKRIQDFFESSIYQKIYGDVLVKHKLPCDLSFTINFTGDINNDQLIAETRKYIDTNIDGTFSLRSFVSHLYNEGFVNNVREPIEVSYTQWNDEYEQITGTFTDELTIRPVDFFRIANLEVQRL